MKSIQKFLILLLILSTGLYAEDYVSIKENDETYKKLKMSVKVIENPKDKEAYSITVKIGILKLKDHDLGSLDLSILGKLVRAKSGKMVQTFKSFEIIRPTSRNGEAIFNFQIRKSLINKNILGFTYHKNRMPLTRYKIDLSDYIDK